MFLAQLLKKVRCEVGLWPNAQAVRGDVLAQNGLEERWLCLPSQSACELVKRRAKYEPGIVINVTTKMLSQKKDGGTESFLFVPYRLYLPSLACLCSSCPLLTSSNQPQALAGCPALLHGPSTTAGDSKLCCWPHYPERVDKDTFLNPGLDDNIL